jgi:hypothetical protein
MYRLQAPASGSKFVKGVTFNVESVRYRPIKLSAVEDVGVSDQGV